jgi:hypothetical protein
VKAVRNNKLLLYSVQAATLYSTDVICLSFKACHAAADTACFEKEGFFFKIISDGVGVTVQRLKREHYATERERQLLREVALMVRFLPLPSLGDKDDPRILMCFYKLKCKKKGQNPNSKRATKLY